MAFVPIKTAEQQAQAMVLGTRELLVNQRTQTANALRGYATEFGMIAAKGLAQIDALVERVSTNEEIPLPARQMMVFLGNQRIRQLLVVGAMAVIQRAKPDNKKASPWLLNVLNHRPKKVAAVALANKMARIAWAIMESIPIKGSNDIRPRPPPTRW
jgi:transposase